VLVDLLATRRGASAVGLPGAAPVNPTVSVVIPTLDEAQNLPYVINSLPDGLHEIIVVDGRSRDDTERVALALRHGVRIVRETRRGKGAAINAGFRAATGDILVIIDADGSMDGADITTLVDALQAGADYVKGSRFASGGGSVDITPVRRLGDLGLCLLIRTLFGARYSDATYGLKAIWRRCLEQIDIDVDGFEVEILIDLRAHRAGLRVAEVACFEMDRLHGSSNLNALRDGLRCFGVVAREWWRSRDGGDTPRRPATPGLEVAA
jgi:glycosyltransferase involved in cell wall biosynthesis